MFKSKMSKAAKKELPSALEGFGKSTLSDAAIDAIHSGKAFIIDRNTLEVFHDGCKQSLVLLENFDVQIQAANANFMNCLRQAVALSSTMLDHRDAVYTIQ